MQGGHNETKMHLFTTKINTQYISHNDELTFRSSLSTSQGTAIYPTNINMYISLQHFTIKLLVN